MDAITVSANSAGVLSVLLENERLRRSFDRLIVVDNGSTDDTVALAEAAGAEVVHNPRGGYGAGVNAGARLVGGECFAVLNPDIRFDEPDVVARLATHFEDPDVAVVAPALRLPDGRIQGSARRMPSPWNLAIRRHVWPDAGAIREPGDVDWAVGACYLVRRSAWDEVGGFDEAYRLYFEDVDLCLRLRRRGWRVHYDTDVVVEHEHQAASRKSLTGFATRQHARSATLFFARNPVYVLPAALRPRSLGLGKPSTPARSSNRRAPM